MNMKITFIVIILCNLGNCDGFLGWLFNPNDDTEDESVSDSKTDGVSQSQSGEVLARRVPFEIKSADDKFLNSGRELMMAGLSELDSCHHRVIAQLKTSCSDITEEDLAKMGVALLNCQSEAEGRATYTCTEHMTVAECTKGMDPNTWNSYHIISNRARSVCYAVRQQQFQRQTQIAVNQLASSTEHQVYFMQFMQESHEQLSNLATDTLKGMAEGQQELTDKQDKLKDSQVELQSQINSNLEVLSKEKSLIAAGHQELASMTNDLKHQLENTTNELLTQDKERKQNHDQVVQDLADMQQKAKEAWQKLDQHMDYIAAHQQETAQHYNDTLVNLKKMNDTINYLLKVVHEMQSEVDQRLGWISTFMGGAGENLALLSTCTLHCCYFVLAAMVATFLQTPIFTRLVLLLLVPLNAIAEIRQGVSLEMAPLTLILITVAVVNWIAILMYTKVYQRSAGETHGYLQSPATSNSLVNFKMPSSLLQIPKLSRDDSRLHELTGDEDYNPSTNNITSDEDEDDVDLTTFMTDNSVVAETTICSSDPLLALRLSKGNLHNDSHISASVLKTPQLSSTVIPSPSTSCLSAAGELSMDPDKAKRHLGSVLETVKRGTPSPSASSRGSSPARSRSSTPNKRFCTGTTKAGLQCRQSCTPGKDFCWRHGDAKST